MIPYKDDNPTDKSPIFTMGLIIINVSLWLFFRLQGEMVYEKAVFELGMIPYEVLRGVNLSFDSFLAQQIALFPHLNFNLSNLPDFPGQISPYLSIFSSMFMHGGFLHLAGNMLYLWIFGNNIEDYLGHIKFLIFYLFCGLLAGVAHLVFNPASQIPTVGASGAISGVLGAYLILYPRARVYVLVPIFYYFTTLVLPAGVILVFWFIFQFLSAIPSTALEGGGVAYWAHIGGFVAGFALIWTRKRKHPVRRGYGFGYKPYRRF